MLFKDLHVNYPVYVLDKQEMTIVQGKTTTEGFHHVEMNPKTGKSEMFVDITIEAAGKTSTYSIPENLAVSYTGNLVLATEQSGLVRELESMQQAAKRGIDMVDYYKKVLEKSPSLLAELNPAYRERQETEKRFTSIEKMMQEQGEMMLKQQELLTKLLEKSKP